MAECDVLWFFLKLSVVFVCNFGGVMAQEEVSCYGSGSIALSVILTLIVGALLGVVLFLVWKKFIKPKKGQHLILETDPEKGKGEYAFDNPGFKDAGLTPVGKALEKSKLDSGNKTKWNQWSPLGVLTLKNEKKRTLDDSAIQDLHKIVTLRSHDFTGLGFNICGNMKQGIFIKDILHRGPAFESGKLNSGDRINSVTISFEHIVYEDALAILSYASPYEVIVSAKSGKAVNHPGQAGRPAHPIFRSSSTIDLSHVEKSSKKRLFQPDDSSDMSSNYSSLQKTRSNATTLERTRSKSPKPNQKLIKPKNKLNHDQLKLQLEQNIVEDYKETMRMKNDLETPQRTESEHQKTENKHHKFGIQVLPMERSPKSAELSQNDNNINLEKAETVIPVVGIDEVDRKVAPPVKKREKINKAPEIDAFTREDPLNGSGIKRDVNNIPLEIPNNMLYAAMAARKNRKSIEEDDIKSPKKKGKAPAPPGLEFDEIYPVEENDNKLLIASKNLNKSDDSIEKLAKADYNSDSDIETDNQSSVNTIELNASDITVHQSEENEEKQNRRTASTGDLTKIQKTRKTSSGTLERAQSLDITDTTMPALAAKKRKAGKIEDSFDSKTSSDDSLYGNALINKEPRLSLILDGLNTFQRSRLKKSTEWGNMEDAILNLKQDGSFESVGRSSSSYEDIKLSSENLAFNFDAKLPEFDALVNKIKEIKEESVEQVNNQIYQVRDYVAISTGQDYTIKTNEGVKVNRGEGYEITINKPDEIRRSEDFVEYTRGVAEQQRSDVYGINKIEVENQEGGKFEIVKTEMETNISELDNSKEMKIERGANEHEKIEIKFDDSKPNKHERYEIKFDQATSVQNQQQINENIQPQNKLRTEKPEPPKRFQSRPEESKNVQIREIRTNASNNVEEIRVELPDVKMRNPQGRSSKTILNEKVSKTNPIPDIDETILIEKSMDIGREKPDVVNKQDLNVGKANVNEKVVVTKPERSVEVKTSTHGGVVEITTSSRGGVVEINTGKPDGFMEVNTSKLDRFVDINTKNLDKFMDINTNKPDRFVAVNTNKPDRFVDANTNKPDRFFGINITKPEGVVDINTKKTDKFMDINTNKPDKFVDANTSKFDRFVDVNTNKPDRSVDVNTNKPDRFFGINITKPEGVVDINTNKPDRFMDANTSTPNRIMDINTSKPDSFININSSKLEDVVDINTHKPDRFVEVNTNKPDRFVDVNTNKPDRFFGINITKPEGVVDINTNKPEGVVDINTNKPDRFMDVNTSKPNRFMDINTSKPDSFININTSKLESVADIQNTKKPDKFVDINSSKHDRFVDVNIKKPEGVVGINTNQSDLNTTKPNRFMDINTSKPDSFININTSKHVVDIQNTKKPDKFMDINISKHDRFVDVNIKKPEGVVGINTNRSDVNTTNPNRFMDINTSKPDSYININTSKHVVDIQNTKKPDKFVDINSSKPDRFVEIKTTNPERSAETKIGKPEGFTVSSESTIEINTENPERFVGMQINTPKGFIETNPSKPERMAGIKVSKPERLVEIKTGKPEAFVEVQTNRSESTLQINAQKPDRVGMKVENTDNFTTNKTIKTGKPESFVEIQTNRSESTLQINTQKPDRVVGIKVERTGNFTDVSTNKTIKTGKPESFVEIQTNIQKSDNVTDVSTNKPDRLVEIKTNRPDSTVESNKLVGLKINTQKTNKPDDAMAKRIQVAIQPETSVETISINDHKPTIKHKHVKPDMSQVNSFILAERDATNKNFQPATVKTDDTNVSDDIKVSRHSTGSLERAKTEKSDNVSNITIPSFEVNANKTKNVAESVKNFENIIVSTPDLIKNITIAEAIHDLNNEVTIDGPSSLTVEIPGEILEEEFKAHNGIKMRSNGDINKLEVSSDEKNSNSLTYITEIQVLTPEIEQVSMKKNLDNDFESYIKNFESNIKNFETNIHSFEQNIQDVSETAKKDVSASTKSSITVNETVDAAKELLKVQEIVEEQLKKLPEMRFTTSSYESQIKPPEKRQSQIEILRSNFEKSTSPPRLGKSEPSPPKSRIPVLNKTPPTSPERRDSKILDTEPDKEILEIMSSHIPMTSSLKYQPKTPTRNVTVTSIRSNSKIPSGLPTYNSRPPVPPRKSENDELVQVSTNGNDSSFRQWVFNPSDAAVTNITVTETKYERK